MSCAAAIIGVSALYTGCESPTATSLPELQVVIESPEHGTVVEGTDFHLLGRVSGGDSPSVTYSVNGSAFAPAGLSPVGTFSVILADLAPGNFVVTVRAHDRGRTSEATSEFELLAPMQLDVAWPAVPRVYSSTLEVMATVVGPSQPLVEYSVSGSPFVVATQVDDGMYRVYLDAVPAGPFVVEIRATDRGRVRTSARQLERLTATMNVNAPAAGGIVYGRVVPFDGDVTPLLAIRTSVNGGAEMPVNQSPPLQGTSFFNGEAHPLRNGPNTIRINAYDGEVLAASTEFEITAEVAERLFDVTVIEISGSTGIEGWMGNDGRVAGNYSMSGTATRPFTWKEGVLTELAEMTRVTSLNHVGTVLGEWRSGSVAYSVLWDGGSYTALGFVGGDINDKGYVLDRTRPGYWDGSSYVEYAGQPGYISMARAINNSEQVAGGLVQGVRTAAAMWFTAGTPTRPEIPGAVQNSTAFRIGDGGHVLLQKQYFAPIGTRYAIYHDGWVQDLGSVVGYAAIPGDVNSSGTVAGTYRWHDDLRPFTWRDGRTTDVKIDSDDWMIDAISSIDDDGRLLAAAARRSDGQRVLLRLTPRG